MAAKRGAERIYGIPRASTLALAVARSRTTPPVPSPEVSEVPQSADPGSHGSSSGARSRWPGRVLRVGRWVFADRGARGPRQGRRRQRRRPSRCRARHPVGVAGRSPARRARRGRGAPPGMAPFGRLLRRRDLPGPCRAGLGSLADGAVPADWHRRVRRPRRDGREGGRPPHVDERNPRDRARLARRVGGPLRRRVHPLVGCRDTVADPARRRVCDRDRGTARTARARRSPLPRALLRSHLIFSTAGRCTRRPSCTA